MNDSNDLSPALAQRLTSLEQRLASVEQMALLLGEAQKTALVGLQNVQPAVENLQNRVGGLEHEALAQRIFDGLDAASKMYRKTRIVIFVARDYFGDNTKYAFLAFHEAAQANNITCYLLTEDE